MSDYRTIDDPYCYAGTHVLINKLDIHDPVLLSQFEAEMYRERLSEPLPNGKYDPAHYQALHRHLFGDVFDWAGLYRTVRIQKETSVFCYPEHIAAAMNALFAKLKKQNHYQGLSRADFAANGASFLAEINAIHPFREGNGRTQMIFLAMIAHRAGFTLHLEQLNPSPFLTAMIHSFHGDEDDLRQNLLDLIED